MRRIRYQVACSLDGYIADSDDGYDWIVGDPDIDFAELFDQFDTLLMGRRTFEAAGGGGPAATMRTLVFSHTLPQADRPDLTIVSDRVRETLDELRREPGKDIWLYGGGELFRSLLELGCVDTVEPAIIPVLLGGGRPFLPAPAVRSSLTLTDWRVYPKSGIVLLKYDVVRKAPRTKRRRGAK